MLLIGARKSEILTLRREWFDFQREVAFLPTSKPGAKILPLGEAALELIQQAPEKPGNPYVCSGEGAGPGLFGWHLLRTSSRGLGRASLNARHPQFALSAFAAGLQSLG